LAQGWLAASEELCPLVEGDLGVSVGVNAAHDREQFALTGKVALCAEELAQAERVDVPVVVLVNRPERVVL
jgi:hypothetical protein